MADITSIIVNIGASLDPLQRLITGFAYLLGFMFIWAGIKKLKGIADARARSGGQGKMFIPLAYFMGGFTLFFLPTMFEIAKNTLFGVDSPLAYASWLSEIREKYGDSTFVMTRLTQFAGVLWFIRGTVLLVQASEPGVQQGPKGMAFLVGGVIAINITYTLEVMSKLLNYIITNTI